MTRHTPGKWEVYTSTGEICGPDDAGVQEATIRIGGQHDLCIRQRVLERTYRELSDNLTRIVECANALDGIPTEELGRVRDLIVAAANRYRRPGSPAEELAYEASAANLFGMACGDVGTNATWKRR